MLDIAKIKELDHVFNEILKSQAGLILSIVKEGGVYTCTFCRGSFAEKLGYDPKKMLKKPLSDFMSEEDLELYTPYFDQAWKGRSIYFKGQSLHNSEDPIHYLVNLVPIFKEEKVVEIVANYSDISQFIGKFNMAEEFEKEKTEFWRNVNYEVRTPLNSIAGIVSLLQDTALDDVQKNYVNIIQQSFNKVIGSFDELLYFSKLETGEIEYEDKDFNIKDMISSVIESLQIKADKKHLDLTLQFAQGLPENVKGDANLLRQLIHNFTDSIISVLPENGKIDVQISKNKAVNKDSINVSVGYETQGTSDFSLDGVDLGDLNGIQFATAKHLISNMQGKITQTKTEKGKLVEFDVELLKAEDSPKDKKETPQVLEGKGILLVIRHGQENAAYIEVLSKEGGRLYFQYNEHDVIETLLKSIQKKAPITSLVIDDDAIEMSAIELIRDIRSDERLKELSITVLLSEVKQSQSKIFMKYGAQSVLVKPIGDMALQNDILDQSKDKTRVAELVDKEEKKQTTDSYQLWAHILVAEDNPVNRMMAQKVLEKMGCKVRAVENGKKALEAVQTENYDLVLMDCLMPEMDGYTASLRIKELADQGVIPDLPIIALTAQTAKQDREKCIKARMDNYLSKPVSIDRLKEVLKMYLRHRIIK